MSYLNVSASNAESCPAEIANVESWADNNNLKLNRIKSADIVFVRPRSRVPVSIPSTAVPGFERVEFIKALGSRSVGNFRLHCSTRHRTAD